MGRGIPWILGTIGVIVGGIGVAMGVKGAADARRAQQLADAAKERHDRAAADLDKKRQRVASKARSYTEYCNRLRASTIKRLVEVLQGIEQKVSLRAVQLPADVHVQVDSISGFRTKILEPQLDVLGLVGAASASATTASSTVALVGLLGTASTGAGISGLTGAAASNASLAWLGGGSLAAGGGGVAVGTVVLAGVAIAPALAIGGCMIASKGEKAMTEATAYDSRANQAIAQLRTVGTLLDGVVRRLDELRSLLESVDLRATAAIGRLDPAAFDRDSDEDVAALTVALQLAAAMSEIMSVSIIDGGGLAEASYSVQVKYAEYRSAS